MNKKLTQDHLDALDVCFRWFGGHMGKLDTWVGNIEKSIILDLIDGGYLRSSWTGLSYYITLKGRRILKTASFSRRLF